MKSFFRPVDKKGILLWIIFALLGTFASKSFLNVPLFVSILLGLNSSVYLVMVIDKIQAVQSGRRLSERSLYFMTLFGSSLGMIASMYTLRHKSRKTSFQMVVWGIIILQSLILYSIYSSSLIL
ncbi:DUF1294 domain-containing protein [Candidatus Uhrbacteria bacterium]|nr:DUF1294 domain-containing protein [Candidatus Uhrbacteria bacterium]